MREKNAFWKPQVFRGCFLCLFVTLKNNDKSFRISGSEHIVPEHMKQYYYWDWIRGYSGWEDYNPKEEVLGLRFEKMEKLFYNYQYNDFCEAQRERNRRKTDNGDDTI